MLMISLLVLIEIVAKANESQLITKIRKVNTTSEFFIKIFFGFAQRQEKRTLGLSYKLNSTRNSDKSVLIKGNAINIGKIKVIGTTCYVPHYTPNISNQAILSKPILSKVPTEIQYVERSISSKS